MCSFVNPCDAWFKRKSIAGAQSIYWNISKFTVNPSPAGTPENSPAIHRWVIARERKSPERDERTPLLANRTRNAGLGYSRLPLRDGKIAPARSGRVRSRSGETGAQPCPRGDRSRLLETRGQSCPRSFYSLAVSGRASGPGSLSL